MDLTEVISLITPEIRNNLATAIEIGRWPDGNKLTQQQLTSSMQAVIAWDSFYGEESNEPFKVQKGGEFKTAIKKTINTHDIIKIIS